MLVNVAFVTLIERKVLSLIQARVGPNKVGVVGMLQPAADAVKLFSNRITLRAHKQSFLLYKPSPVCNFNSAVLSFFFLFFFS